MAIPFELTTEQFAALGRITATFATLEHVVHRHIGALTSENSWLGEIVAAPLTFPRSLDVLDALVRYQTDDPAILSALQSAVSAAQQAAESRNKLIHSRWFTTPPDPDAQAVRVRLKRGSGVSQSLDPLTNSELDSIGDEIEDAVYEMSELTKPMIEAGLLKNVRVVQVDEDAL